MTGSGLRVGENAKGQADNVSDGSSKEKGGRKGADGRQASASGGIAADQPAENYFRVQGIDAPPMGQVTMFARNISLETDSEGSDGYWPYREGEFPVLRPLMGDDMDISMDEDDVVESSIEGGDSLILHQPPSLFSLALAKIWKTNRVGPEPPALVVRTGEAGETSASQMAQSWSQGAQNCLQWCLWGLGVSASRPYATVPLPRGLVAGGTAAVKAVAWHRFKMKVAVAMQGDEVHVYQLEGGEWLLEHRLSHEFQKNVTCLEWKTMSGTGLAVGCRGGALVWEGQWVTHYLQTSALVNVTSLQWCPNRPLLAVGSPSSAPVVWDVATSTPTRLPSTPLGSSSHLLRWSPDGNLLLQAGLNATLTIWETATWTAERWKLPGGVCHTAAWAPDSSTVAFGVEDTSEFYCLAFRQMPGHVHGTWSTSVGTEAYEAKSGGGLCGPVRQLAWDESGERLAVSFDETAEGAGLVALYCVSQVADLQFYPIGFVRGPSGCGLPSTILYKPAVDSETLLTIAWENGDVSLLPHVF